MSKIKHLVLNLLKIYTWNANMRKTVFIIFTICYLVVAAWLLFFSSMTRHYYPSDSHGEVSLIPFHTIIHYFTKVIQTKRLPVVYDMLFNVAGNILLFIPLGLIIHQLKPCENRWYIPLLYSAVISLCVETTQLLTHIGEFDVDDIILNTLGCGLGFMAWRHVPRLFRQKC